MVFGVFHDQGVKVWVQGVLRSIFSAAPSPDFDFFGQVVDQGALRAVTGLERGEADKPQKRI